MKHYCEEELLDFIDGNSNPTAVQDHLEECHQCAKLYKELQLIDIQLQQVELTHPSSRFTDAVVDQLFPTIQPEGNFSISFFSNYLMIFGVAVSMLIFLVSLVYLGYINTPVFQELGLGNKWINDVIAFTSKLSGPAAKNYLINALFGMSTFLALILLDKSILKPYFQKRKMAL